MTLTCSQGALIPHLSAYFSVSILCRSRLICPRAEGSPCILSKSAPITVLQKDTSALSGRLSEWKCHLKSSTPIEWLCYRTRTYGVENVQQPDELCWREWKITHSSFHYSQERAVCLYQHFIPLFWTWMLFGILSVKYISSVISREYLPSMRCNY